MKVICFVGETNSGKTTTIMKILKSLLKIVELIHPKNIKDIAICFKYNSELIGLCSHGDVYKDTKDRIEKLENLGCQTIICASRRANLKVHKYLKEKFNDNLKEIHCNKPIEEQKDDENFWETEHRRRINEFENIFVKS